jgi:hypothetical protein
MRATMSPNTASMLLGIALVVAACAADTERQWMKVNEKYTTAEFRRDHAECSKSGKLDDACMRSRGWVDVTGPKAKSPEPEPRYIPPGSRPGR